MSAPVEKRRISCFCVVVNPVHIHGKQQLSMIWGFLKCFEVFIHTGQEFWGNHNKHFL